MKCIVRALAMAALVLPILISSGAAEPPDPVNQVSVNEVLPVDNTASPVLTAVADDDGSDEVSGSDDSPLRNAGAEEAAGDGRAGDINLNGVPYEVSDAVLFTRYFIYGMDAFHIDRYAQVGQTDINDDGLSLTVGDLIVLIQFLN